MDSLLEVVALTTSNINKTMITMRKSLVSEDLVDPILTGTQPDRPDLQYDEESDSLVLRIKENIDSEELNALADQIL